MKIKNYEYKTSFSDFSYFSYFNICTCFFLFFGVIFCQIIQLYWILINCLIISKENITFVLGSVSVWVCSVTRYIKKSYLNILWLFKKILKPSSSVSSGPSWVTHLFLDGRFYCRRNLKILSFLNRFQHCLYHLWPLLYWTI